MVNQDEVKVRQIPKFQEGKLLLSGDKVFFTVQGEGSTIGKPAIFIRTHICNLACDWSGSGGEICDAWYTWDKTKDEYWTEHSLMSFEDLYFAIKKFNCKRLVFTGGEPLLQQQAIIDFLYFLYKQPNEDSKDWFIEIETNGTIGVSSLFRGLDNVQINCSPKLASSGMLAGRRISYVTLMNINKLDNSNFKFVVTDAKDLDEVESIAIAGDLIPDKIIIMPEGTSTEILSKRMQDLVDTVRDRGWRLVPRLQCFIWGNKRGV